MPALQDCLFPAAGNLFPPEISVKAERKNENRRLSGISLMRLLSRAVLFIMRRVNRASMSILTAAVSAMPLLFVHLCFKDFWSLREEMLESDGARKKLLRAAYYAYMSKEKILYRLKGGLFIEAGVSPWDGRRLYQRRRPVRYMLHHLPACNHRFEHDPGQQRERIADHR